MGECVAGMSIDKEVDNTDCESFPAQKVRNTGVDIARIVACYAVVVLHLVGRDAGRACAIAYFSAGFAIPVFFIASGYFVLQKVDIDLGYAMAKAGKFCPIVLAWVCLTSLLMSAATGVLYNPVFEFFKAILQKGCCSLFWFFFALLTVYFVVSFKFKWIAGSTRRICYATAFFGLICFVFDMLTNISLHQGGIPLQSLVPQTFRIWTWLYYFFLGGLIGRQKVKSVLYSHRKMVYLILVLSFIAVLIWDYCIGYCRLGNKWAEYHYDNLFTMLYAASLFCTCDFLIREHTNPFLINNTGAIARCTMGVYILHTFFFRFTKNVYTFNNVYINFLLPPAVFLTCLLISLLMMRNRSLSRLISIS